MKEIFLNYYYITRNRLILKKLFCLDISISENTSVSLTTVLPRNEDSKKSIPLAILFGRKDNPRATIASMKTKIKKERLSAEP